MASRSLMSARPMMSSLVDMSAPGMRDGRWVEGGKDEQAHEPTGLGRIGEVDVVRRVEQVREDDAGDPLCGSGHLGRGEEARQVRLRDRRGLPEHELELVERELRQ